MITLATLAQATAQQVFDQVVAHMQKQGVRSATTCDKGYESCLYRAPGGLKCAAGCLISDDEFDARFDNNDAGTSWRSLAERGEVPEVHVDLITGLQRIHDNTEPHNWEQRLEMFANTQSLNFNKPS